MEENEKIEKHLDDLEENMKKIDGMSTKDKYRYMFAQVAAERDAKKNNSIIKKIRDRMKKAQEEAEGRHEEFIEGLKQGQEELGEFFKHPIKNMKSEIIRGNEIQKHNSEYKGKKPKQVPSAYPEHIGPNDIKEIIRNSDGTITIKIKSLYDNEALFPLKEITYDAENVPAYKANKHKSR